MDRAEASWVGLVEAAREMGPDPELEHLSDGEVERAVRDGASTIAAAQCRWLLHVAELVVREVWAEAGARTPGVWLSWACGEPGSTAREHVRVGLALRKLPRIRQRFAAGTLSYSKVRAITSVATPEIEQTLIDLADSAPASQLKTIIAQSRRCADEAVRWQDGPPDDVAEVRDLRLVDIDDDTVELRVRLPRADAVAVEERLDRLVDLADRADRSEGAVQVELDEAVQHAVDDASDDGPADAPVEARLSRGARRAIALADAVAVAVAAGPPDRSGTDDHLVVLHVGAEDLAAAVTDPDGSDAVASAPGTPDVPHGPDDQPGHETATAPDGREEVASSDAAASPPRRRGPRSAGMRAHVVTGRARGMHLPRSVLARLTCDGDLRVAGVAEDGHPADIGRRSRHVPADLRRALHLRDRHCRFPGCHRSRGLHAHHVIHWAAGGPTDLSNLVLLCAHHHRFVHDRGWTLRPVDGHPGRWSFHAPNDTTPVPPVLPMPGHDAAASVDDPADTLQPHPRALQPPWWDGWYDLDETIAVVTQYLLDLSPAWYEPRHHPAMVA